MIDSLLPARLVDKAREVVEANRKIGRRVTVAESCTGGLVSAAITEIPGSSEMFEAGYVTYSNAAKIHELKVSEERCQQAVGLCKQSDQQAALGCMDAFGTTDFRDDLPRVTVPTLVIHGDSDGIVPFEGSAKRTHEAIDGSDLVVIDGGTHGINVSHAKEFNDALLEFLKK